MRRFKELWFSPQAVLLTSFPDLDLPRDSSAIHLGVPGVCGGFKAPWESSTLSCSGELLTQSISKALSGPNGHLTRRSQMNFTAPFWFLVCIIYIKDQNSVIFSVILVMNLIYPKASLFCYILSIHAWAMCKSAVANRWSMNHWWSVKSERLATASVNGLHPPLSFLPIQNSKHSEQPYTRGL